MVDDCRLHMVQLHGDETPRYCEKLADYVSVVKAFRGPLPQANLVPTGGVTLENVAEWIAAGAAAVAVGGALTSAAKSGGMKSVTQTAQKFLEKFFVRRVIADPDLCLVDQRP